ncbi:MAG: hypothetical protein WBC97_06785 [Gemmatimonadales bacterium]
MSTAPTTLDCPAPVAGKITVCGQIADVESGAFLEAAGATGAPCGTSPSADGPCSVAIGFYDADDFAANPSAATPLASATLYVDDRGRYRAENLTAPPSGYLAVSVDDALGTDDRHRPTVVVTPTAVGEFQVLRAFVTRNQTDSAWSAAAGLVGPTFADSGVIAAIFRYQGVGRSGVTITRSGTTAPADDYYFSDAGQTHSTVVSSGPTGTNGGALLLNSGLVQHSGTGGEPTACHWPSTIAASIPGVVFVQLIDAETAADALCP